MPENMKKLLVRSLKVLLIIVLLFVSVVALFINFAPAFGDAPSGESLDKIAASPNFDGEKFVNLVATEVDTRDPQASQSMAKAFGQMLFPQAGKNPTEPMPSVKFNSSELANNHFVWLGHSTVLMNLDRVIILADPVFHNASPLPGTVEPFEMQAPPTIDDLPRKIDVVIISHDHYDHLDYKSIQKLDQRVERFFVPLGIKAHLTAWGVAADKIEEKDWHDVIEHKGIVFTMTPARHFSGRGISNRFSTLWCSWVIKSAELNVFFNGDSGYFDEFKNIGSTYGPFDIAFMENGAYDKDWSQIHMMPEEAVQANIDLQSKKMFPIHWGKFDLARHPWDDPIIRTSKETALKGVEIVTPLIGEVFALENAPQKKWWEALR
jgi:L-ascorbate metabolism protein UlaG (beta-lactamase superfamily)